MKILADGDRLVLRGPMEGIDSALRDGIRENKSAILDLLERAAPAPERSAVSSVGGDPTLSAAQRRFLELQALEPDSSVYNLPGGFRLSGPLDRGALRSALARLVERQAILRSAFRPSGSDVHLEVLPPFEPTWIDIDLTDVPDADRERALRACLEEASDVPIDLTEGPPFHLHLVKIGSDDHALLITAHSAVWDGWSFDVFLEELGAHYEGVRSGTPSDLAPLESDYFAYAREEAARRAAGHFDRSLAYWEAALAGSPPSLSLSRKRPVSGPESFDGARVPYHLESPLLDQIRSLAKTHRATTNMVLVAALDVLLHRCTGETDIMISTPFQGRSDPVHENLIGVFVNTLFLRARVDPEATFATLLEQVRQKALEAVEHQDAPSDIVVERLSASGLARPPHELMFVFQQAASRNTRMADIEVRSIMRGVRKVSLELIVWAREYDTYLDGAFDYRLTALDESHAARLRDQYLRVIEQVLARPDVPIRELQLELAPDIAVRERRSDPEPTPTVDHPIRISEIVCGAEAVSQADIEAFTASVRGPFDAPVPVQLDGSWQSVALLQALAAAGAPCQFTEVGRSAEVGQEADEVAGLRMTTLAEVGEAPPGHRSWELIRRDAAVLAHEIDLEAGTGLALFGDLPPSAFVSAVIAAGMTGARVMLPEPGLPADGLELDDWASAGGRMVVIAGAGSLQELVQTGWEASVDTVISTDPFMGSTLVEAVRPLSSRLLKGWCPSDGVAWATLSVWDSEPDSPGSPAPGVTFQICDAGGGPASLDAPGDLVLVDHRGSAPGEHHLGLRARWPADELLCILEDGQDVWEVNGSRVVGSRVAGVLGSVAEISDVHVFLERTPEAGRRVAACITPSDGSDEFRTRVAATTAARAQLPRSWIPTRFHVLPAIPRDSSGSVDDRSLRLALRQTGRDAAPAPTTARERAIAHVWEESLGLRGVTADDNFFDIGGHSLLAVQIVARLADEYGIRIEPRSLFFHSLQQLAQAAESTGSHT